MVALVHNSGGISCGGSVIDREFVLTAAHCVSPIDGIPLVVYVVAGQHDLSEQEPQEQEREVDRAIIHPSYKWWLTSDIALLKLKSPLDFNDKLRPVCLPEVGEELAEGTNVTVTGWGRDHRPGQKDVLQQIVLPVSSQRKCFSLTPGLICTLSKAGEGGLGICSGDSGGPLMVQKEGFWYQHGVNSHNYGLCNATTGAYESYYTKVSAYKRWIDDTIAENRSE